MMTRREAIAAFGSALTMFAAGAARAADTVLFNRKAFDAALKAPGPVLIDISATWCSTCAAQKAVLSQLTRQARFAGLTIFEVDYDTEKDVMRTFGAQQRSTLIAFKGGTEVGRIVGDTRSQAIEALLAKAI